MNASSPSPEPCHATKDRVQDGSLALKVCSECGQWALRADVLERAELRAALIALTDLPQMTGERLRAVRKVLGLTQRKLGETVRQPKIAVRSVAPSVRALFL